MKTINRQLKVLTDGMAFAEGCRFHLSGRSRIGLYPDLFLLECWNLSDSDVFRLQNTKEISVMRGDSCLGFGRVSDVFSRTAQEGTVTTVGFSLGLELWLVLGTLGLLVWQYLGVASSLCLGILGMGTWLAL
jgi:hypothetical protein